MIKLSERKWDLTQAICIVLLLGCFFYLIRNVYFTIEEELALYYIVQKGDFFPWLDDISHGQGRINFYVLCWFWGGPMFLGPEAYKLALCLLVVLDFGLFFRLLYVHVNHAFAYLCTTILILFLQISNQHNLVVTYSFLHIPFLLSLLSMHALLDYTSHRRNYGAVLFSALCSMLAAFFQENFVLFYIPCFLIIFFAREEKNLLQRALRSLWTLRFHVLGGLIFLASYGLFQASCGGSTYTGVSTDFNHPLQSLRVLVVFLLGMFPGQTFYHLMEAGSISNPMDYFSWKSALLSAAASLLIAVQLYRMPKIRLSPTLITTFAISAVLSCLLHAFTPKYLDWVFNAGTYSYVPSFYAYFFLGAIGVMLLVWIYQRISWHKVKNFFLIIAMVVCTLGGTITSISNRYFAQLYQELYEHYQNYDALFATCDFSQWEPKTQILLKDPNPDVQLNNLLLSMTTVYYFADVIFTRNPDEIDTKRSYYILDYGNGSPFFEYIPGISS